ncbi:hypothetical protein cypCar_00025465 [Cyprinus carpio]|nr:hypothetical protein cypCar_00025465 [Cyprinus carpio]
MSVDGLYCNATTDEIGTCWPRSNSGRIIERPCPEFINGVKYNTSRIAYRECLDNGTWALKSNYSNCEPILEEKVGIPCPIIMAWAIGKLYNENEQCWFGKEPGKYIDYIYQGPVILVLLINFVFLFNIVRILMTKLRASTTSETIQYR